MAKVFIGYAFTDYLRLVILNLLNLAYSGLAWHTDDATLRSKFEEFGTVEEAVSSFLTSIYCELHCADTHGC
jgi:RNA recognition motif-containing protein